LGLWAHPGLLGPLGQRVQRALREQLALPVQPVRQALPGLLARQAHRGLLGQRALPVRLVPLVQSVPLD
jgi:hypothetical protein